MKIMISPADDEEEEIIIKCNALTADLLAGDTQKPNDCN